MSPIKNVISRTVKENSSDLYIKKNFIFAYTILMYNISMACKDLSISFVGKRLQEWIKRESCSFICGVVKIILIWLP